MDYEVIKTNPLIARDYYTNTIEYIERAQGLPSRSDKYDVFLIATNKCEYIIKLYYDLIWADNIGYRHKYKTDLDTLFNKLGFNTDIYYTSDSRGGIISGGYKDNCNEYLKVFNRF